MICIHGNIFKHISLFLMVYLVPLKFYTCSDRTNSIKLCLKVSELTVCVCVSNKILQRMEGLFVTKHINEGDQMTNYMRKMTSGIVMV